MFATAPAPSRTEILSSRDVRLYVEHFEPRCSPRLALVVVHGLGLHSGLYRHVAAGLNEHGVAVTLFDFRGHGRSEGRRGHVETFEDYLADLDSLVALARWRAGLPLALMGHSLGGLVVLSWALGVRAGTASRVVAAAPWLKLNMKIQRPTLDSAKVFRRLRPALEMENLVRSSDLSGDPEVARSLESDPLVHHVLTARGFASVLEQQDQLRSIPPSITTPTLILMGGQDHVVSSDAARDFSLGAAGRVQIRLYPAMGHGLFFEPDWRTVVDDLAEWLLGDLA